MSGKARQLTKSQKRPKVAEKKKPRISIIGVLLGVATLLGAPAAVVTLLPRVTATISDPADPDLPFSSSVTITNTGYIPLDSVSPFMGLGQIGGEHAPPEDKNLHPNYHPYFRRAQWPIQNLGLDDKFTFAINDVFDTASGRISYADIAVVIDYEIPVIHLKREKVFPMEAHKQRNGKFYWYSKLGG